MFKVRVDHYHHACEGSPSNGAIMEKLEAIGGALLTLIEGLEDMNQKLATAIAALQEEVADSTGKLASIRTYLLGIPDLVATAVQTALADADVEASAAADAADAVRSQFSAEVDATLAAIASNPGPGEDTNTGGGEDTSVGGGEDTGTGDGNDVI